MISSMISFYQFTCAGHIVWSCLLGFVWTTLQSVQFVQKYNIIYTCKLTSLIDVRILHTSTTAWHTQIRSHCLPSNSVLFAFALVFLAFFFTESLYFYYLCTETDCFLYVFLFCQHIICIWLSNKNINIEKVLINLHTWCFLLTLLNANSSPYT